DALISWWCKNKLSSYLQQLRRLPDSGPFQVPLDWQALGLEDYPDVVQEPMDLQTISERLQGSGYDDEDGLVIPEDFWEDLALVWQNCCTYYDEDLGVEAVQMAERMRRVAEGYEEKFQDELDRFEESVDRASYNTANAAAIADVAASKIEDAAAIIGQKLGNMSDWRDWLLGGPAGQAPQAKKPKPKWNHGPLGVRFALADCFRELMLGRFGKEKEKQWMLDFRDIERELDEAFERAEAKFEEDLLAIEKELGDEGLEYEGASKKLPLGQLLPQEYLEQHTSRLLRVGSRWNESRRLESRRPSATSSSNFGGCSVASSRASSSKQPSSYAEVLRRSGRSPGRSPTRSPARSATGVSPGGSVSLAGSRSGSVAGSHAGSVGGRRSGRRTERLKERLSVMGVLPAATLPEEGQGLVPAFGVEAMKKVMPKRRSVAPADGHGMVFPGLVAPAAKKSGGRQVALRNPGPLGDGHTPDDAEKEVDIKGPSTVLAGVSLAAASGEWPHAGVAAVVTLLTALSFSCAKQERRRDAGGGADGAVAPRAALPPSARCKEVDPQVAAVARAWLGMVRKSQPADAGAEPADAAGASSDPGASAGAGPAASDLDRGTCSDAEGSARRVVGKGKGKGKSLTGNMQVQPGALVKAKQGSLEAYEAKLTQQITAAAASKVQRAQQAFEIIAEVEKAAEAMTEATRALAAAGKERACLFEAMAGAFNPDLFTISLGTSFSNDDRVMLASDLEKLGRRTKKVLEDFADTVRAILGPFKSNISEHRAKLDEIRLAADKRKADLQAAGAAAAADAGASAPAVVPGAEGLYLRNPGAWGPAAHIIGVSEVHVVPSEFQELLHDWRKAGCTDAFSASHSQWDTECRGGIAAGFLERSKARSFRHFARSPNDQVGPRDLDQEGELPGVGFRDAVAARHLAQFMEADFDAIGEAGKAHHGLKLL
ncbi:unnamed protein product, partial [Prorocentrum cordatum]